MHLLELKCVFKIAGIYTTSVVGAGFASGQELVRFFVIYGMYGFLGLMLSGFLFSLIGAIVLDRVHSQRIRNYDEFIYPLAGWKLGKAADIMGTCFMLSVFFIMVTGTGSVISNILKISILNGVLVMALIIMIALLWQMRGAVIIGSFLSPILIVGITVCAIYIVLTRDSSVFSNGNIIPFLSHSWIASSVLYVSYNSILSVVVLTGLLPFLTTRRVAVLGGVIGGGMLCVIAILISASVFMSNPLFMNSEFPLIDILLSKSTLIGRAYELLLWLAMFLTAVTSGCCVCERLSIRLKTRYSYISTIICALSLPFSIFGFAGLISTVYPIFGYLGMFLVILILISGIVNIKIHD